MATREGSVLTPDSSTVNGDTGLFLEPLAKGMSATSIQPDLPLSTVPGNASQNRATSDLITPAVDEPLALPWVFRYPEDHVFDPNPALPFWHTWSDVIRNKVTAPLLGNLYEVPGPGYCVNWREHPYFKLQFKFNAMAELQEQPPPSSGAATPTSSTSTSGDNGSVGRTTDLSRLQEMTQNGENDVTGRRRWSVDSVRTSLKDLFRRRRTKEQQQGVQQRRDSDGDDRLAMTEAEREERRARLPMECIMGLMARNDRYANDLTPETRAHYRAAEHDANVEMENRLEAIRKLASVNRSRSATR